ncbi:MAG TPA: heme NO-binding domain-containing protein [Polyangiaceae bacterium]|nr:heme NO-binding domain-containing protein [Polyangiaceae bacterium]
MIGLVPKLLVDFIGHEGGEAAARRVLEAAGAAADRHYRLDSPYDDGEVGRLWSACVSELGLPVGEFERRFAAFFGEDARRRWPAWFRMSPDARSLLLRQPTIHNSLATGLHDPAERRAVADKFRLEAPPGAIVVHYRSPHQLCGLYMALARWVLDQYGEAASVEEVACRWQGAGECEIHVRWAAEGAGRG